MFSLPDTYIGSSCVIKTKNNDLLTMGTMYRIRNSYMDISNTRNELTEIPYNLLIKIEVYNTQIGFRVLLGKVYISTKKLLRVIDISEATGDERREYFRVNVHGKGYIYDLSRTLLGLENEEEDEAEDGIEVDLVDISLGGLLFKTRETFEVGERLHIRLPDIENTRLFDCIVRRHVDFEGDFNGYGCELQDLDSVQEDRLYKFILKRQNEQLKRVR